MLTLGAWLSADSSAAGQLKTKKSSVLPGTDINKLAGAVLNEQHLQLKKYGKTLMGITPTNLHSLKIIAIKQCSATEIFADLYPDNNSNQYLRVLHKLQDILCAMDDSTGFKEFLKKVKMTKKKRLQNEAFGIVSGWAMHQCLQSRPELNHTWRSFNRITPFWLS